MCLIRYHLRANWSLELHGWALPPWATVYFPVPVDIYQRPTLLPLPLHPFLALLPCGSLVPLLQFI